MCSRSGIRAHKYRGTGSNYIHYPGRWAGVSRVTSYCLLPAATQGKNHFLSQNYFCLRSDLTPAHRIWTRINILCGVHKQRYDMLLKFFRKCRVQSMMSKLNQRSSLAIFGTNARKQQLYNWGVAMYNIQRGNWENKYFKLEGGNCWILPDVKVEKLCTKMETLQKVNWIWGI